MVQFFQLPQQPQARLAEQMGLNFGQGTNQVVQQQYQKGLLQKAFQNLNQEGNFLENLKSIAPILLTTPGGAQALGELAPVLGKAAENQAYSKFLQGKQKPQATTPQTPLAQPNQQQTAPIPEKPVAPTPEEYYRSPEKYASPESLYPERTAGMQPEPEMSQNDIESATLDLMNDSRASGKPIPYQEALSSVMNLNNARITRNQRIEQQKAAQQEAQEKITGDLVNRSNNAGYIKNPEDRTVAARIGLDAKRFPDKEKQWEYVRNGMRQWETAKSSIQRAGSLDGPLAKMWKKGFGTYKDKETLMKDVQEGLKFYKKYGLFDEARNDLRDNLGFGSDDVERTLFPLDKQQKQGIEQFPKSPFKIPLNKSDETPATYEEINNPFPGEKFNLEEKEFDSFKKNLQQYLTQNPKANLVVLRTELNQGKRYSHQDINRAVTELIDEGLFEPDSVQSGELNVIRQAPLPGLLDMFKNVWTGAK